MIILPNLLLPRHNLLEVLGILPLEYVFVDISSQQLFVIKQNKVIKSFTISTSQYGIGNKENSLRTPPGLHLIDEKIGANAPVGRIFKDRIDTGINWYPGLIMENCILTRILRLRGLQAGVNKGPGIDTYERYVYIHGTNRESEIGKPLSNGCVCMKNLDIIELFDSIMEGTFVVII